MAEEPLQITQENFDRYLQAHYNPTTVRLYSWIFRSALQKVISQSDLYDYLNLRKPNPFWRGAAKAYLDCFHARLGNIELPKDKRKHSKEERLLKDYKFLDKKDIDFIIANTSPYISLMVRLYFETGLRLRELIYIKLEDIDLTKRTMRGIGKGNKPFRVKFSETSALLLENYLSLHNQTHPFYFDKEVKDQARAFYWQLKQECKKLGIEHMHPHRIRHSLGRHLAIDLKLNLQQVQVKLRHSDISTTQIYATTTDEEVDAMIEERTKQLEEKNEPKEVKPNTNDKGQNVGVSPGNDGLDKQAEAERTDKQGESSQTGSDAEGSQR